MLKMNGKEINVLRTDFVGFNFYLGQDFDAENFLLAV